VQLIAVKLIDLDYVRMVQLPKYTNLILEHTLICLRHSCLRDGLDGTPLLGVLMNCQCDLTKRTFPQNFPDLICVRKITCLLNHKRRMLDQNSSSVTLGWQDNLFGLCDFISVWDDISSCMSTLTAPHL
jgi:hypothetical protein